MRITLLNTIKTVFLFACLTACSPKAEIPIEERITVSERLETEKIGGRLIRFVQPGDTLYSIAFANNLNVNELAQWNGIVDTRRLAVGQRIRLTKPIGFKAKKTTSVVSVEVVPSSQTSKPSPPRNNSTASAKVNSSAPPNKSVNSTPSNSNWYWPVRGKVIERFSLSKGHQGIGIQGKLAEPVFSAKAGEVVYVGNALKGYGNLIIIKHSEHFLSAYAHNQKTFVVEGQKVKVQHRIGSVGSDNKRRNALHFQIRKDGKPVNPLSYLPRG